MPIEQVYIARVTDGLMLVASMDSGKRLDHFKKTAQELLKKLNSKSTAKMSIEADTHTFHYLIDNGICYLTLTEKKYPKRLAFLFMEALVQDFMNFLREEFGADGMHNVETVGRQYAFIKFDRVIQKRRRDYADQESAANINRVAENMEMTQNIMRRTIDDVLDRGRRLDDVQETTKSLSDESSKYKWGAKQLSLMTLYKQYAPFIALGAVALLVLIVKFYW